MSKTPAENWMQVRPEGLYFAPADFYIDPHGAAKRAVITHGHADHARGGHGKVFGTPETLAIMATRYGEDSVKNGVGLPYGERINMGNDTTVWLASAGHIRGSAQAVIEYRGIRIVVSGDYKRASDPTCAPFEVVPCDVFITEATFALPVFEHPSIENEIEKLLRSLKQLPNRIHLVGVYALGKCQRLMAELRKGGYEHPFYMHGALVKLTKLYESYGQDFGEWLHISELDKTQMDDLCGRIVLCPPSALADRWSRRFKDPLPTMASGWMQIRARARQRRAEMALIVSDHADWNDLIRTCLETGAKDIWITHGRVEALEYQLKKHGLRAKALNLVGREDEAA